MNNNKLDFSVEELRSKTISFGREDLAKNSHHYFYAHGKLLLTGEYLVMDGAKALAMPTILGQSLSVKYKQTFMAPRLKWSSFDFKSKIWLNVEFELWNFDIVTGDEGKESKTLQQILRNARSLNPHFLREQKKDVLVETRLEFPIQWGLGSSSSLLYNIAQWAYTSPFELAKGVFDGSGYDLACAQSVTPIMYYIDKDEAPSWKLVNFRPVFSEKLFFVYHGHKKKSQEEVFRYRKLSDQSHSKFKSSVNRISKLSSKILKTKCFNEFCALIAEHEEITSHVIELPRIKDSFARFEGELKSLGAWGGDFFLAASDKGEQYVKSFFESHGVSTVIRYNDLICDQFIGTSSLIRN
jgi:mevalonate kinase